MSESEIVTLCKEKKDPVGVNACSFLTHEFCPTMETSIGLCCVLSAVDFLIDDDGQTFCSDG